MAETNLPGSKPARTASATGMAVDTALVRELAEMLADNGLTEIEVADGARSIRVSRGSVAAAAVMAPAPAAVAPAPATAPAPAAATATAAAPAAEPKGTLVKSPMVGTAYLAPEPGAADFASLGTMVKAGDTLLIIEAMKVMNTITSPAAGTIVAVHVTSGQPVEYDQPLVVIG